MRNGSSAVTVRDRNTYAVTNVRNTTEYIFLCYIVIKLQTEISHAHRRGQFRDNKSIVICHTSFGHTVAVTTFKMYRYAVVWATQSQQIPRVAMSK